MSQKLFTLGPVEMFDYTRERTLGQLPYFRTEEFSRIHLECSQRLRRLAGAPEDSHVYLLTCSGTGAMEAVVGGCFSGAAGGAAGAALALSGGGTTEGCAAGAGSLAPAGDGAVVGAGAGSLASAGDRLLVVEGGGFGSRFAELAAFHRIPNESIKLSFGEALTPHMLDRFAASKRAFGETLMPDMPDRFAADVSNNNVGGVSGDAACGKASDGNAASGNAVCRETASREAGSLGNFTGLLVNLHETATGQLYDKDLLAVFCRRHGLYFVCDAISSFLADPLDFEKDGIDALIISTQKALALPPGFSIVILSDRLYRRMLDREIRPFSLYFDFRDAEANAVRGQTPFTPAVGMILALRARLERLEAEGGAEASVARTKALAEDFRARIKGLVDRGAIALPAHPLSNACTPLVFPGGGAEKAYRRLSQDYGLWLNPNGGALADTVLRVGHLGNLGYDDNILLAERLAAVL